MTGPRPLPPDTVRAITYGKRFLAADRAQLDVGEIATWDAHLLRERRLLVPIDVQALYVPQGSTERMVRLPMLVAGPGGEAVEHVEDGMPDPFDPGSPRPAGVHLHWAMPDALLRGTLDQRPDGAANRLALPALPDRWVVLRLVLPVGATEVAMTGWVLEADRALAVPLATWRESAPGRQGATPSGVAVPPEQLTGTVGGSVTWSGVYDAVLDRFAFHDPLDDLQAVAPNGVDEACAAYVVAGWWSDPQRDVLDAARGKTSLAELLERLRWGQLYEWGDESWALEREKAQWELRKALGLTTSDYWSSPRPHTIPGIGRAGDARPGAAAAHDDAAAQDAGDARRRDVAPARASAARAAYTPLDATFLVEQPMVAASTFAAGAERRYVGEPWHLRASLLHGAIYGVPVAGAPLVDRRPAPSALAVALGHHDDDVLGALASDAGATAAGRRTTERLLAAFTAQQVNRLGSADGVAALEEREHAASFTSRPSGTAGTDRFLQRVQTGGAGGLGVGKHRKAAAGDRIARKAAGAPGAQAPSGQPPSALESTTVFSTKGKPTLVELSEMVVNDLARSRVGDVLAPAEARVVDRPAARFTAPDDPMVAVRGAARSLRHGNDGRGSADGKLTCRWPTHVITSIDGLAAESRFLASLGNGSVPSEVLTVAREVVLHDPYHDEWLARALTPAGADPGPILRRLKAESVLRFGADGTYDGATAAFLPDGVQAPGTGRRRGAAAQRRPEPGVQRRQTMIADALRKFSLYRGVDPDLVGVTTWAQPWVPLWLEWEVTVEGLDPPSLEAWRLGTIDLERADGGAGGAGGAGVDGATRTLRGRSVLTTGAARTLHDAIADFLEAERALDDAKAGQVDKDTEDALRTLDSAVQRLDVVTATLDGVRAQLLGFPVTDGLRRPGAPGVVADPAPVRPPHTLLAGMVTLTRARLVDAFGRTLDVPVAPAAPVRVPARAEVAGRPGALAVPPRLLRAARWQYRLVDAATPVGAEGVEARVDQVDPTLQVSPVAGFLLPDHLDESLEFFGADGAPLGELLHEPVSGGVTWEIAAGRTGPADASPRHDLTPAQRALGELAIGLVAADAAARAGAPLDPDAAGRESALSALLRAIDTTLWTVDAFAALGSEHVAGLVGRPIAVVRAQLRLELEPPADVDLSDPARAAEWEAAARWVARYGFPVRLGELTRSDDGVLALFVDDDWSRVRLVDKAIAGRAAEGGRSRGQLGLLASAAASGMPAAVPIDHPYVAGTDDADTLVLHVGQTVTLTLLMHPAGRASLTSGVLPRKALALARDWVGPGLARIAPSLRTGPVLVETDLDTEGQVRLPKVSVFGKDQNFLWRDTPATWRTDAILAATQTALLPDTPAELREGWIRVAPELPDAPAAGAGGAP